MADRVRLSGDTIPVDRARIDIESVAGDGFTATFWLRGNRTDMIGTAV